MGRCRAVHPQSPHMGVEESSGISRNETWPQGAFAGGLGRGHRAGVEATQIQNKNEKRVLNSECKEIIVRVGYDCWSPQAAKTSVFKELQSYMMRKITKHEKWLLSLYLIKERLHFTWIVFPGGDHVKFSFAVL